MDTFRYSEILQHLQGFDAWLTGLGLTPRPNDRVHQAFQFLRRAEEASCHGQDTGEFVEIRPGDWFPVIEALEASVITLKPATYYQFKTGHFAWVQT